MTDQPDTVQVADSTEPAEENKEALAEANITIMREAIRRIFTRLNKLDMEVFGVGDSTHPASPPDSGQEQEVNRGGRIIADDNEKITMSYRQFSHLKFTIRTLEADNARLVELADALRKYYDDDEPFSDGDLEYAYSDYERTIPKTTARKQLEASDE